MGSNRTCILIYGMHRSGTSALSGALSAAGLYFGSAIAPPSFDNPKGFFENYKIQEFNDFLLKNLDRSWDDTRPLPYDWLDQLASYKPRAKTLIKKEFKNKPQFAIKDPRFSILLPFWERIFSELNVSIKSIILLRSSSEIISSLQDRNYFHQKKAQFLIWYYLLNAERNSRNKIRTFVQYDQLCANPLNSISEVTKQIDLSLSAKKLTPEIINKAISIDLRNHKSDDLPKSKIVASHLEGIPFLLKGALSTKVLEALDELYSKYNKIDESQHIEALQLTGKTAKLLIDYGQGYSEGQSIKIQIQKGNNQLRFDLPKNRALIHEITFSPVLQFCIIRINKIELDKSDGDYELIENSNFLANGLMHFNHDHPRIILKLKSPARLSEVQIDIEYVEFREDVVKMGVRNKIASSDFSKKEHLIYHVVKSILFNPIRLLKNINYQNFQTLRSALKRESPRQIIRNFKKLLERRNTQNAIIDRPSTQETIPSKRVQNNSVKQVIPFRVLYVTPQLPEFDTSSGGRRAISYLTLLSTFSDVYIFSSGQKKVKYVQDLEQRGFFIINTVHAKSVKEEIPFIHVLLYSWYYTFHDSIVLATLYQEAMVIIDSVDVQWVREERAIGIQKDLDKKRVEKNKKKEIEAYSSVDRVWAVSLPDKHAITSELSKAKIDIISNIHKPIKIKYTDPGKDTLLFIGGYNHYPNLTAVDLLARNIFPKVLAEAPSTTLLIAGSNAPDEVVSLGQLKNVEFLGFVPEEKLAALYEQTLLSVSPLLVGAGVKGKVTEAMAHMVPVLTNKIGNEGIDLIHNSSGLVVEDIKNMPDVIIKAVKREYDLKGIAEKAQLRLSEISNPLDVLQHIKRSVFRSVDICIVTFNKLDLLKSCIQSILTHTEFPNYNIIVYSNGCTDGSREYLLDLAQNNTHIECILSDTNDVFVKPNNQMMHMNPGHDKILLNNDIVVTQGWLSGLYNSAYLSSRIGIVGAKVLYFDGRLQEFGAEIYEDGSGQNIGKWDEQPLRPSYSQVRAVGYVSGCSMYIKHSAIERLAGFSEEFHPCYYEDSDLCYRAWKNEIGTLVTPDSIVYHHEGATSGTNEDTGFKSYQKVNKEKFVVNHKSHLKDIQRKIKKTNRWLNERITLSNNDR